MPRVSVLITTYNRSAILPRAVDSVLKQDYDDFEIVVTDDCSSDDTPAVMARYTDPRVKYIRHPENVAGKHGDKAIFRNFIGKHSSGEFFVWLCDDDFWVPPDLLSGQVAAMDAHRDLAFSQGGSVFIYPKLDANAIPPANEDYITHVAVPGLANSMFPAHLYPDGLLERERFLDLYATDPKNRNMVTGATLYRRAAFERAGVFKRDTGVRWQSGYEMVAGAATRGDVHYIDRPCVGTSVDLDSASYRGTQLMHLKDCLRSIDAAFHFALQDDDADYVRRMGHYRRKMMHSILFVYALNKLTYRLGKFAGHPLEGIVKIFEPEIALQEFHDLAEENGIPLSSENKWVLSIGDMQGPELKMTDFKMRNIMGMQSAWWKTMIVFPERL